MRRHAKASSAGSNMRRAGRLGRIVRGAFATRASSPGAKGSSAPSYGRAGALALIVAALALLALAPSALASKGVVGFIGSSSEGSAEGQFSGPNGVAVNQAGNDGTGNSGAAAGDVYVVDRGNNRVQQFSAAGVFKRTFGLNVGGAGVNVCTASCSAGTSSPNNAGMNNPQGVAVDQANGLLYASDQGNRRIDIFSAGGVFQGAFGQDVDATTAGTGFEFCPAADTCQAGASSNTDIAGAFGFSLGYLAVAPSGDVLVADKSNRRVDQFTPTVSSGVVTAVAFTRAFGWNVAAAGDAGDTVANEYEICTTLCQQGAANAGTGGFGSDGPAAIAVDSAGASYVIDTSNSRVQKFSSTAGAEGAFAAAQLSGSPAPLDIAVDRSNNHVFAIKPCNSTTCSPGSLPPPFSVNEDRVLEFDSSGALLDTHAAGAGITSATALAEQQSNGNLYMTVNQNGFIGALTLSSPLVPPLATVDSGSGFTHAITTATFTGAVDPKGLATSCHFEYSTDGSTWIDADGAQGTGILSAGEATITSVEAALGTFALDQTISASGVPSGDKVTAVDPISHTITLSLAPTTSGPVTLTATTNTSVCTGLNPAGGAQAVSQDATGLAGSQLYHVRLAATKAFAAGSATSGETTFTTDPGPPLIARIAPDWSSITTTSVEIEAEVNPENQGTSYHVEYVTSEQLEESGWAGAHAAPAGLGAIGHANHVVVLSTLLSGLSPGVEYRARAVAANPSGTVYSPEVSFATYPDYGSLGSCSNEQFRTGPSAALPDCRAYEQASPADKNGTDVRGVWSHTEASRSGDAVLFQVQSGISGGSGSTEYPIYEARRGASGWTSSGLLPPTSFGQWSSEKGWTTDLNLAFNRSIRLSGTSEAIGMSVADLANDTFQSWFPYPESLAPSFFFAAASNDDSKVFFEWTVSGGGLPVSSGATPAAGKDNLYMYDRETEELTLVGVLPSGEGGAAPAGGSFAGPYDWFQGPTNATRLGRGGATRSYFTQAGYTASTSGDSAFFTAGGTGQVYARLGLGTATPETVRVSASHRATAEAEKPAIFMRATPSGSDVFFTSCQKLTEDSTAVSTSAFRCDQSTQGADLYRWQADGAGSCGEAEGCLSDLTVDGSDPQGAQAQGVIGTSDNGEYVYFVANGVLASNEGARGSHATLGGCGEYSNGSGFLNAKGDCNLYLWHDNGTANGETTFVAPLANTSNALDAADWEALSGHINAPNPEGFVSADGKTLVFRSLLKQSAASNDNGSNFYRYQVGEPEPLCLTCIPTGAAGGFSRVTSQTILANFTTGPVMQRNMSADGNRFFFETSGKFVPADTNGDAGCPHESNSAGANPLCQDVYEWEADGAGSCHTSPGCYYLLSSGTGAYPAFFNDASVSGNDIFIFTHDQLVPSDTDGLQDVYDISVDGGLASQHPVSAPSCEAEGCRGAGSSAGQAAGAGTASFEGPGNPAPSHGCKKGFGRRHGVCVKRHHHTRRHRRTANRNRRAAR